MEFDYETIVLAVIVFSLMLMVIRLRFEVKQLRDEIDRITAAPRPYRSFAGGAQNQDPSSHLSREGDERLRVLMAKGNKIQAIKEARELYNLSLKDAKDYVEAL
ncbi:ribosomal protein L7/L12 [Saccharibacillus kuerlensis]|uniref:Large ribosomal subunit protein bL12 C-terminal domain-containing protein n=1 Tax=Saccharibacillus kuerlensis TaxID=459527 RepID=A0ABQ2L6Z3_9BACL|nr:ribosomal protein L7/L12 [Saccharibacillus kuerlensis]GGO05565.1 hypothetical protein GCM10010969_32120 [Saccharibacillus kuerlensis]